MNMHKPLSDYRRCYSNNPINRDKTSHGRLNTYINPSNAFETRTRLAIEQEYSRKVDINLLDGRPNNTGNCALTLIHDRCDLNQRCSMFIYSFALFSVH